MKKKFLLALGLALALTLCVSVALADTVAKIGDAGYDTIDAAIEAAVKSTEPVTIDVLADCTVAGEINVPATADVTIKSDSKVHIGLGKILLSGALTFEKVKLTSNNQIYMYNASKLQFTNSELTMDGKMTQFSSDYYCGAVMLEKPSTLVVDSSTIRISNYAAKGSAVRWDESTSGYDIRIQNGSYFSATNCYAGFTGTHVINILNSTVDVSGNRGNGANGSHFYIEDSNVTFNDNGSHGLSAGMLTIKHSNVTANGNGGNGIHTNNVLKIEDGSVITVENNACSIISQWTIPGAMHVGAGESSIENSTVTIRNNRGSGIYQKSPTGKLTIADDATVTVVCNTAEKLGYGGGIYVNGEVTLGKKVALYNNHAGIAGDDIYVDSGIITFGNTGEGWMLDGAPDCNGKIHPIDGWYEDGLKDDLRWNADAEDEADRYIHWYDCGTYQGTLALKAAHDVIPDPETPAPETTAPTTPPPTTPAPTTPAPATPAPTNTPEPVAPPQTGDNSTPLAWLCALLACAACLTVLRFSRKRRA